MVGGLRALMGSMIWPATQTPPDLCFDMSWLGSAIPDQTAKHIRAAQELLRRAKAHAAVGLRFMKVEDSWHDVVLGHACEMATSAGENLRATMAELAQ